MAIHLIISRGRRMRPGRCTRATQRMTLAPQVVPGSARATVNSQHMWHPGEVQTRHEHPHVAAQTAMALGRMSVVDFPLGRESRRTKSNRIDASVCPYLAQLLQNT